MASLSHFRSSSSYFRASVSHITGLNFEFTASVCISEPYLCISTPHFRIVKPDFRISEPDRISTPRFHIYTPHFCISTPHFRNFHASFSHLLGSESNFYVTAHVIRSALQNSHNFTLNEYLWSHRFLNINNYISGGARRCAESEGQLVDDV